MQIIKILSIFNILKSRRHLFIVIGALFFQIQFATPTHALSFNFSNPFSSIKFGDVSTEEKDIEKKTSKMSQLKESIQIQKNQVSQHEEEIKSLNVEIKKISENIASMDDMFVKITRYASDSSGNKYADGNCTWYVKSKRPDIGNYWGNANQWINGAKNSGFEVGSKPKIGAIGVSFNGYYGHVAYVEKISGENVVISEMNYKGFGVISSRITNKSEFQYIYAMKS